MCGWPTKNNVTIEIAGQDFVPLGIDVGRQERSADSRVEVGQARSIHSVAKPTARVANPAALASSPNIHPV